MATEEELHDAQIAKIKTEEYLIQEQLRELKRGARIVTKVGQGLGVGIVLALAGMALFGPIKDTLEAESKLATLNSKIAERTNADLQQRIQEREKLLGAQEKRFTENLSQLAEDLERANATRDAAILRNKELAKREQDLSEKLKRIASEQNNNADLLIQAKEAKERAAKLENAIAKLKAESEIAKVQVSEVQARIDIRPLANYEIRLGGEEPLLSQVKNRLSELGLSYTDGSCKGINRISYYHESDLKAAQLLSKALDPINPNANLRFKEGIDAKDVLYICVY